MFSPVLEALFLRTRDQHGLAGRRAFYAVAGLALFHAAVVTPWVEHQRDRSSAMAQAQRFRDLAAEVAGVGSDLDAAAEAWQGTMTTAVERLVEALERDLVRLEATRRELAAASDEDQEPTAEEASPRAEAPAGPPTFEIRNPEWIAAIGGAENRYALLAALEPVVEELIVRPRFAELNRAWRDDARPAAEARLDGATAGLNALRGRFREAGNEMAALEASLTNLRRVFRDLELRPPEEPYWWASPETAASFELRLPRSVVTALRQPPNLGEARDAVDLVAERRAALGERLEREQQRSLLADQDRQRRLADFGATPARLGLDLHAVAATFPLLLGLSLAALMIRRNQRLRDLAQATRLMAEDPSFGALRRWCLAQLKGGPIGGDADPEHDAEAAWRSGWLRALGSLVLALAWIALAALQVRQLPDLDAERWLVVSALAAAAVLVATVHRLAVARRLVVLLSAAPSTGPAVGDPDLVERPHDSPVDSIDEIEGGEEAGDDEGDERNGEDKRGEGGEGGEGGERDRGDEGSEDGEEGQEGEEGEGSEGDEDQTDEAEGADELEVGGLPLKR